MYHGVGSAAELGGADPVYAVSRPSFEAHLRAIGRSVALATQLNEQRAITAPAITFDDGHITNFTNAFPALVDAGMTAEFYVNSATVGQPCFVDWAKLDQMARAGMSIQSHGHRHVFFADLDMAGLRAELERSKKAIEDRLGREVTVLAPPGGRYDRRTIETALALGYRALAVSRPGLWKRLDQSTVPRFPIYAHTGAATVAAYRSAWSADTLRAVARYRTARLGQQVLGNGRYDALRNRMVGAEAGGAS
jgi:peptidoglycan/xylan/chitin deacetylase (PgdA/CDA1 family)